jgi:hypothetical protein
MTQSVIASLVPSKARKLAEAIPLTPSPRHCEERSDEAIPVEGEIASSVVFHSFLATTFQVGLLSPYQVRGRNDREHRDISHAIFSSLSFRSPVLVPFRASALPSLTPAFAGAGPLNREYLISLIRLMAKKF